MFDIGAVLFWKNNVFQSDNVTKDRYFIYLGNSSVYSFQMNIYTVTTTSRTRYYEPGGYRERDRCITIRAGTFGFPKDSVDDVNLHDMPFYQETILEAASDIRQVGKVDYKTLKAIYQLVMISPKVPPRENKISTHVLSTVVSRGWRNRNNQSVVVRNGAEEWCLAPDTHSLPTDFGNWTAGKDCCSMEQRDEDNGGSISPRGGAGSDG